MRKIISLVWRTEKTVGGDAEASSTSGRTALARVPSARAGGIGSFGALATMLAVAVAPLSTGCGEADATDGSPKSRTNESGEIERHLRRITADDPPARPFPTIAQRPTTTVLPDTAAGQEPPSEAARARALSEAHVHEHGHVVEPSVAPAPETAAAAAEEPAPRVATAPPAPAPDPESVPRPEANPAEETSSAPSQVELTRVVVARAVTDREPVGAAPFGDDVEQLFLFVEARNDGSPTTLAVRWIAPDGTRGRAVDLEIPTSRRWRTWATTRRTHDRPGRWTAVVTDPAGRELGRRTFEVSSAPSA